MSAARFDEDRSADLSSTAVAQWVKGRLARRGRALQGDHGLITVVFGLFLTVLLIVTAIVIDLGMDRATVRLLKTDTDLAAIAGGYFMAGNGQPNDVSNPQAACNGIVTSITTNIKDFPSAPVANPGNGCSALWSDAASCIDNSTPKRTVTFTGAPYVLTIDYPVWPADIADSRLVSGVDKDDGDSNCARMRVTMTRSNPAVFAGIVGNRGRVITQSTTFKVNAATIGNGVPALLILERLNCSTLTASGQGGIKVSKSGAVGGWIHTDTQAIPGATISTGTATYTSNCNAPASTSCTTNSANNYSVYATAMPSSGGPSVIAEDNGTVKGVISAYAQAGNVGGSIGCNAGTGINNATTGNPIVSRNPVDNRYNIASNPYGRNITNLHSSGYAYTTQSQTISGGYVRMLSGPDCSASNVVYKAQSLLINCSSFSGSNVVFTGKTFVFTGTLNVAGGFVAFPNAKEIYLRGCSVCNNGYAIQVSGGGFLSVNSGVKGKDNTGSTTNYITQGQLDSYADYTPGAIPTNGAGSAWPYESCISQRNGPGNGGSIDDDNQTVIASFAGSVNVQAAEVNFCQTMLYIGSNWPTYIKQSITAGGNCSAGLPCPTGTANLLQFNLNPGSARPVQWTAPLHNLKGPDATAPFDDLSLWTEASGSVCSVAGKGSVAASGIFFMPNCDFSFGGQSDSNNPVNAQFISRTLTMAGQGLLYLKPNPDQSIVVPHPGGPQIIR